MTKRSVTINGHATSISLEAPFWQELRRMAGEADLSVAALIAQINVEDTINFTYFDGSGSGAVGWLRSLVPGPHVKGQMPCCVAVFAFRGEGGATDGITYTPAPP